MGSGVCTAQALWCGLGYFQPQWLTRSHSKRWVTLFFVSLSFGLVDPFEALIEPVAVPDYTTIPSPWPTCLLRVFVVGVGLEQTVCNHRLWRHGCRVFLSRYWRVLVHRTSGKRLPDFLRTQMSCNTRPLGFGISGIGKAEQADRDGPRDREGNAVLLVQGSISHEQAQDTSSGAGKPPPPSPARLRLEWW